MTTNMNDLCDTCRPKDERPAPNHTLYACQRCGEEYGDGEEDYLGRSPCCGAEGDSIGEMDDGEGGVPA